MYQVFMSFVPLPIAPSKINMVMGGRNTTIELVSGQEVNIIKPAGLTEISFEFLIPHQSYPFVSIAGQLSNTVGDATNGFAHGALETAIKEWLEYLKTGKSTLVGTVMNLAKAKTKDDVKNAIFGHETTTGEPFQFVVVNVVKKIPNPVCNIKVTLEEYEIIEDADAYGFDKMVSVKLKQYVPYETKRYDPKTNTIVKERPR